MAPRLNSAPRPKSLGFCFKMGVCQNRNSTPNGLGVPFGVPLKPPQKRPLKETAETPCGFDSAHHLTPHLPASLGTIHRASHSQYLNFQACSNLAG